MLRWPKPAILAQRCSPIALADAGSRHVNQETRLPSRGGGQTLGSCGAGDCSRSSSSLVVTLCGCVCALWCESVSWLNNLVSRHLLPRCRVWSKLLWPALDDPDRTARFDSAGGRPGPAHGSHCIAQVDPYARATCHHDNTLQRGNLGNRSTRLPSVIR